MSLDAATLVAQLSPPLDQQLLDLLVTEFLSMERRFFLGDWEPATLDGGQFAELASRVVYHVDSGNLNPTKGVSQCLKYVEESSSSNPHAFPGRRAALHLCRVLRTIYKFRSQRGAIHIDPNYSSSEMDASLLIMCARWVMAEVIRVFWTGNTADAALAVREVTRFDVPAVLNLDGRVMVLRTDCTVEQEVLLLLHNAGAQGMTRTELGQAIPKSASAVSNALTRMVGASRRQIIERSKGRYVLLRNGAVRIRNELSGKLALS